MLHNPRRASNDESPAELNEQAGELWRSIVSNHLIGRALEVHNKL